MRYVKLLALIMLGVSILCFAGCDGGKKKAIAEATELKTKLEKVNNDLARTQGERDTLKADLATAGQQRDKLKDQVAILIKDKEAAVTKMESAQATIGILTTQVQDQIKKIEELKEQIVKLQEMMQQLKNPIKDVNAPPASVPAAVVPTPTPPPASPNAP